jgi:hypothetical protein
MPDDRKILRGVRVGSETVTDPDRLDRLATPQEIKYLQSKGYITGSFKGTPRVAAEGVGGQGKGDKPAAK